MISSSNEQSGNEEPQSVISELQKQLEDKENEARLAATFGQQLLQKVQELEQQLKQNESIDPAKNSVYEGYATPKRAAPFRKPLPPRSTPRISSKLNKALIFDDIPDGSDNDDYENYALVSDNEQELTLKRRVIMDDYKQATSEKITELEQQNWSLETKQSQLQAQIQQLRLKVQRLTAEKSEMHNQLALFKDDLNGFDSPSKRSTSGSFRNIRSIKSFDSLHNGTGLHERTTSTTTLQELELKAVQNETMVETTCTQTDLGLYDQECEQLTKEIQKLNSEKQELNALLLDTQQALKELEEQEMEADDTRWFLPDKVLSVTRSDTRKVKASKVYVQPQERVAPETISIQVQTDFEEPEILSTTLTQITNSSSNFTSTETTIVRQDIPQEEQRFTHPSESRRITAFDPELMTGMCVEKRAGTFLNRMHSSYKTRYAWFNPWNRSISWSKQSPKDPQKCTVRSLIIDEYSSSHSSDYCEFVLKSKADKKSVIFKVSPRSKAKLWEDLLLYITQLK